MSAAGIPVFHYNGRMFWSGFAARENLQQILKNTTVDCLWETSGDDYIVYPKVYLVAKIISRPGFLRSKKVR